MQTTEPRGEDCFCPSGTTKCCGGCPMQCYHRLDDEADMQASRAGFDYPAED